MPENGNNDSKERVWQVEQSKEEVKVPTYNGRVRPMNLFEFVFGTQRRVSNVTDFLRDLSEYGFDLGNTQASELFLGTKPLTNDQERALRRYSTETGISLKGYTER